MRDGAGGSPNSSTGKPIGSPGTEQGDALDSDPKRIQAPEVEVRSLEALAGDKPTATYKILIDEKNALLEELRAKRKSSEPVSIQFRVLEDKFRKNHLQ